MLDDPSSKRRVRCAHADDSPGFFGSWQRGICAILWIQTEPDAKT